MDSLDTSRETPVVALEPLRNGSDQVIAAAVSAWLVLDVQRRRPVRILPFVNRLKPLEGRHVLPDAHDKLPELNNRTYEKKIIAR